ncbi:MAG: prolyl oligopeptidase family serine peptidase [Planctomycetales bacterium]
MSLANILTVTTLCGVVLVTGISFGEEPAAGKQVEQSFTTSDAADVPYLLYLPEDYGTDSDQKFPLILFLHGRGESNGPLSLVAKWGPPRMAAVGQDMPFVIISPQCPREDSWSSETQQARVLELLKHAIQHYQIDTDRVYLTGLSMGGYGSWRMAADHPEMFAAVAPVCGGGKPEDARKLKGLPIWVWHGNQDRVVPFQRSVEMVEAIQAAGGTRIKFTSLESIGHNCWSAAYASPELYTWMARHSRSENKN